MNFTIWKEVKKIKNYITTKKRIVQIQEKKNKADKPLCLFFLIVLALMVCTELIAKICTMFQWEVIKTNHLRQGKYFSREQCSAKS